MILKFMELSCDECLDGVVGPVALHEGIRAVRKIAKDQGWVFQAGHDYCPACVALLLADGETLIPN